MGVYDFYKIPLCLGLGKLGIRLGEGYRVTSLYKCIDRKHALGKGRRQLGLVWFVGRRGGLRRSSKSIDLHISGRKKREWEGWAEGIYDPPLPFPTFPVFQNRDYPVEKKERKACNNWN